MSVRRRSFCLTNRRVFLAAMLAATAPNAACSPGTQGLDARVVDAALEAEAESAVDVVEAPTGPRGFRCTPETLTLTLSSSSMPSQLTALALTGLGGAEERLNDRTGLVWRSSDAATAYVDAAGRVSGRAEGMARVWAEYMGGRSSECVITVQPMSDGTRLSIDPVRVVLAPGESSPATVTQTQRDGSTVDATGTATWTSSAPSVAVWNASMRQLVAVGEGRATLTASLGTARASTQVLVFRPLRLLAIEPAALTMQRYTVASLRAIGTYDDGMRVDVTEGVEWSSLVRDAVRVDARGTVQALAVSTTPVPVAAESNWGREEPLRVEAPVTVRDDAPQRIVLSVASSGPLVVGAMGQLRADCTFEGGFVADVANATGVNYRSSNTAVLAASSTGQLSLFRAGTARVTVTFRGVSAELELTVIAR